MGVAAALRGASIDRRRVTQQVVRQASDGRREGGAEEQRLARLRQLLEDALDVVDEAHVQHAVGLVEDQDLDRAQVDGPLSHVVQQASWRSHDDLRPLVQRAHLPVHAYAPVDGDRADGLAATVRAHALLHLQGQLARGHHDEGAHLALTGFAAGPQPVEHGQHESGRLAGAGLGAGQQVATAEDDGDGLGLDGRRLGVALLADGAQGLGSQPKGREGQGVS